jgi:hypothetical protein
VFPLHRGPRRPPRRNRPARARRRPGRRLGPLLRLPVRLPGRDARYPSPPRRHDPLDYVREVHDPWTRPPDATVYLDVDPETGARRAGTTNKLETVEFLERVDENYERLIAGDPDRFVRVDATRPQDAVAADVKRVVADLLD